MPSIRGAWWDRLALNLNFHLKQNDEVLNIITLGVNDTTLGEKDLLLLQVSFINFIAFFPNNVFFKLDLFY